MPARMVPRQWCASAAKYPPRLYVCRHRADPRSQTGQAAGAQEDAERWLTALAPTPSHRHTRHVNARAACQTLAPTPSRPPHATRRVSYLSSSSARPFPPASSPSHPAAPPPGAPVSEVMAHRLETKEGKDLYGKRKQTVEPVFGIIKEAMGFRRFRLRGIEKVNLEWTLVTTSYNPKRPHNLGTDP